MMEHLDSGFRVCQQLKSSAATRDVPIIILTAVRKKTGLPFSPETDGEYLPAEAFLAKPLDLAKLVAKVNDLLGPQKK